ncbi:MAG: TRAP transporter substrate-binding protein DctP [Desulfobacula sp.]|nr:TRAP transporter substrate-binding protein DctP [Desulfobacula sp.]
MTLKISKQILFILILVLVTQQSVTAKSVKFKIATLSPDGSMWMEKMLKGAKQVTQKTDNRVTFKFYPSGRMGNDKMVLKKIKIGQLHGGAVVSGSLASFFTANQLYSQPMKFNTLKEVDYVRKYMDDYITKGLAEKGFVSFGLIGGGFSYIMSKKPVETVQDLRKQKVWIPDNDTISSESIEAFGINPIPLSIADVRISLQSGLIDTVATSPVGALVLQWHTQIKYVTQIPLIYLSAMLVLDKKQFSKVSPSDQQIIRREMSQISKEIQAQNRIDDIKNIAVLKNRGIIFITPNPAAMEEWKSLGKKASRKMVESGVLPKGIADELEMHLKNFHKTRQADNAE